MLPPVFSGVTQRPHNAEKVWIFCVVCSVTVNGYLVHPLTAMASSEFGVCCICGQNGKLSFEHVPPEKAFNDLSIFYADVEKLRSGCHPDLYEEGGRQQQRGSGAYTLCEGCNSKTGRWYARDYIHFAKQGMEYLQASRSASTVTLPFYRIRPLNVVKQIVCMFMSINGPKFHSVQPQLTRLVHNREMRHLPPHARLFAFYSIGDRSRHSGVSGMMELVGTNSFRGYLYSEFTFPPFGFVLTFNSPAPDERLTDITYFADEYAYNQKRTIWLRLPVLPIYTFFPGDYRDRDQVLKEAGQNLTSG